MSVRQIHQKIGQWSLRLKPDAPPGLISSLTPFGHIVIAPGRWNPVEHGDAMRDAARYVGVFREIEAGQQVTLSGVGLESWLSDEDGKGQTIESALTLTSATFAAAVTALAPAAVPVGTIHAGIPGTFTHTFTYTSRRDALDYLCSVMGGSWRVTNGCTLDAGPDSALYQTSPKVVIARRDVAGYDQATRALPGDLTATRSWKDYTTRTVIVSQALGTGTADNPSVPYVDMHGNPVQRTRVIDEVDETTSLNAAARAQAVLNLFSGSRRGVRLSVDEFDVSGDVRPGDSVYVFDPAAGLYDTAVEVPFRGQLLNPAVVRVLSVIWPVTAGYSVGFRATAGSWVDLTEWVEFESPGGGEIEVSDSAVPSLTSSVGGLGTQVAGGGGGAGDTAVPGVPVFGTFTTTSYQPDDGLSRAAVKAAWSQPLNTDGSTIVDGDHYELRLRPTGSVEWQVHYVPWDQTSTTITNLPPSTGFDWQIRAVDYATPTNYGAWSATTTFATADDTTAPATPAPPTVAASLIAVQVTHTLGVAAGGTFNLPLDMDHLEVHLGASSGFTPDATTLAGKLQATGAMVSGAVAAVGTFPTASTAAVWVKMVAVDRTGNRSPASSAASATATLIDTAHISDLTVSKITAGTLSVAVTLSGSIKTGTSGARTEMDINGIRLYNAGGTNTVDANSNGTLTVTGGSFSIRSATSGARIMLDTAGLRAYNAGGTNTVDINSSGSVTVNGGTITGGTIQTASSGARVVMSSGAANRVDFYSSAGDHGYIQANAAGTNSIGMYSNNGNEYVLAYNGTCSLNASSGVISASSLGSVMVNTSTGDHVYVTGGDIEINTIGGTVEIDSPTTVLGLAGQTVAVGATTFNLSNVPVGTGVAVLHVSRRVYVGSSARRFKTGIRAAEVDTADILTLDPITYLDKSWVDEHDGSTDGAPRHYGFIADDIADGPLDGIVYRDEDGAPFALAYDRIPVLHQIVLRDLVARVAALESAVNAA